MGPRSTQRAHRATMLPVCVCVCFGPCPPPPPPNPGTWVSSTHASNLFIPAVWERRSLFHYQAISSATVVTAPEIAQYVIRCPPAPMASALWMISSLFGSSRLIAPFGTLQPARGWHSHIHSRAFLGVRSSETCTSDMFTPLWGAVALEHQFLEVVVHDPVSLPSDDVGLFLLQLQKLPRKRHVLVTGCHTLCLLS